MSEPRSRRSFLTSGAAAVAAGGVGFGIARVTEEDRPAGSTFDRPRRQHAWADALDLDEHGNHAMPSFHRLVMWDVLTQPTATDVEQLESALIDIERSFRYHHEGVLMTLGWGPGYFAQFATESSPVPPAERLSSFETPDLDTFDACLHVASDSESSLDDIVGALTAATGPLSSTIGSVPPVLQLAEIRRGFIGAGLPAQRQDTGGIPDNRPVADDAPLFMGFRSGFRKNQATEDDVTIESGPLAGGTTMHVSRMRLRLDSWYGLLDADQRAARMFSPETAASDAHALTNEAPTFADEIEDDAQQHGVIGHLQASATARRQGRPLIIRRDFNTVDDGEAGLHFVALQRSIEDFKTTRLAMNAAETATRHAGIDARTNNGINEFIFVTNRANYLIPPRPNRSFPLLASQPDA